MKRLAILLLVVLSVGGLQGQPSGIAAKNAITVSGTQFLLNGKPFRYTGVSFFNAIYNPAFNRSSEERVRWMEKFRSYGINAFRVWCQWDNPRGSVNSGPECTLYYPDGRLREKPLRTLKEILIDTNKLGMVVELTLFSQESWFANIRLAPESSDKAVAALTRELMPYRNLTFQVWNELSERVPENVRIIKGIDPERLVTNSPGFAGVLGDDKQNRLLDYLTPHTSRQNAGRNWEIGSQEIGMLLVKYQKPVVDDEPARCGTAETVRFGGLQERTFPIDPILQIYQVWKLGAYITYHHDMFQTGYGSAPVPPSGIPDPEFSPYHRQVFEFLALRERYR